MEIRGYIAKDLSNEKSGPDGVHYETIRDRISKGKYVEIFFFTRQKTPTRKSVFLPYDFGRKLVKALEIYDKIMAGDIKIDKQTPIKEEEEENEDTPVPVKATKKVAKPKKAPTKKVAKK